MNLTPELWEAFGFDTTTKKQTGCTWPNAIYHRTDRDLYFLGKDTQTKAGKPSYGTGLPETVEDLVRALREYWYEDGQEQGKGALQGDLQRLLGLED